MLGVFRLKQTTRLITSIWWVFENEIYRCPCNYNCAFQKEGLRPTNGMDPPIGIYL